jgi:hypothetical protein
VNNKSDVKGFKALIAVRLKEKHIINNKSPRILVAKKADKRTNAYNRTYDSRPARLRGGDSLNSILK